MLSRAGMLSPAGKCKTFDASADGYVRGEGCGMVVLKPLPAAVRDGDRVLAVLEASAINQDGRSNGITAPNGAVQTELIRRVLRLACRAPGEVSLIEAHGTGTTLGDPIEFEAINAALGRSTVPCALASVKTNLGHLEAAAGIAGLIKAVLQVHHGQIAPHLHLDSLNPHLPGAAPESGEQDVRIGNTRFHIPRELLAWSDEPRLAGVSSFGFGGTNAHVLVAQAPSVSQPPTPNPNVSHTSQKCVGTMELPRLVGCPADTLLRSVANGQLGSEVVFGLLPISARSQPALRASALRFADWLRDQPDVSLADVCAAASQGRSHFEHRLTVVASTSGENGGAGTLSKSLGVWVATEQHPACQAGRSSANRPPRVAFLFTGQGSLSASVGRQLYKSCGVFRDTLDHCDAILREQGVISLVATLQDAERLEQTEIAQPALFALEYALAQTWRSWGIEPSALLGHSVGEYVAACVAGVLTLEDGLKLIAQRGKLMQDCPEGAMLACFAPLEEIRSHLERWGDCIDIAAINGPEQVIVAGQPAIAAAFREELAAHGIESRLLKVRRAFHSALIEPALPGLRELAASLSHHQPGIPLVSNLSGDLITAVSPDYWARHARGAVQFSAGIRTLQQAGITHFLEVGPDAVLSRLGPDCLQPGEPGASAPGVFWLPSLRQGKADWEQMLTSLGRLYVDGADIHWQRLYDTPDWRTLSLPTYPFERFRYWVSRKEDGSRAREEQRRRSDRSLQGWRPWSNWSQRLPHRATGLEASTGGLQGAVAPLARELLRGNPLEPFILLRKEFDSLAGAYACAALRELGWNPYPGEQVEARQLAVELKVIRPYDRLLQRLLQMAEEDGWLKRVQAPSGQPEEWSVVQTPPFLDTTAGHADLLRRHPAFTADLLLAHRCSTRMAAVMRGEADPLEVLFGDEAAGWTERLYRESPLARFYNDLVAGSVRELVERLSDTSNRSKRPVRLLEIGAGTGGATAHVLPLLPADRVEYVFTDVSRLFVAQAALKFQPFPFVHYHTLDLEKAPAAQGFADGHFDLVLAANVLHATTDLRQSLRTVRRLLAPGGVLLLLEGTGPRRLLDLIFGLTEGWWKFADLDLRPQYPLLSPAAWMQLLHEEGFADGSVFPAEADLADPDQAVILAQHQSRTAFPGRPQQDGPGRPSYLEERSVWVLVGDSSGLPAGLAERLERDGDVVLAGWSGDVSLLPAMRPLCLVDFTEPPATLPREAFAEVWVVSQGGMPVEPDTQGQQGTRRVDLDPAQATEEQIECLYQCLRHPDEQRIVIYRGNHRYIPVRATAEGSLEAPVLARTVGFDRTVLLAAPAPERRRLIAEYLRCQFRVILGVEALGGRFGQAATGVWPRFADGHSASQSGRGRPGIVAVRGRLSQGVESQPDHRQDGREPGRSGQDRWQPQGPVASSGPDIREDRPASRGNAGCSAGIVSRLGKWGRKRAACGYEKASKRAACGYEGFTTG